MRHKELIKKFIKFSTFLATLFILVILINFNVYAGEITDYATITDIHFGTNASDNNFKYYHPVYKGDGDHKIEYGDYGNITWIKSCNEKDSVDYYVQYCYDLAKYNLAIKKGDVSVKIYTDSDAWYKDRTALKDQYERPQFEIFYGYSDDKLDLENKYSKDSGTSGSGAEFTWNKQLPSNLRYIVINFDTEAQNAGGEGFAAKYHDMHLYFIDNVDPQIKKISTSASSSGTLSVGKRIYIDVDFDEAVTVNGNSKIKLNILDKNNNQVYANYSMSEEYDSYYRVRYQYTIQEGDYIQNNDYVRVNLNSQDKFAYTYSNGNYNYYIYDLGHRQYIGNDNNHSITENFNTSIRVDGVRPSITNVEFCSETNQYYKEGDNIYIKLTFDDNVYYSSSGVILNLTEDRYAAYQSGNGTKEIIFVYTVRNEITDNPLDIKSNNLFTNGYLKDNHSNSTYTSTPLSLYDSWVRIDNVTPNIITTFSEHDVYKKLHEVKVEAVDNDSGIKEIKYLWKELDDGSEVDWDAVTDTCLSGQILRTPDDVSGSYCLLIRAEDNIGNYSIFKTEEEFKLDNEPPNITVIPNGNRISSSYYLVELSGEDNFSTYDTYFQWVEIEEGEDIPDFNEIMWREYTEPFYIYETGALDDGVYRLYVKGIDELGNEKITLSKPFIIGENEFINIESNNNGYYAKDYNINILAIANCDIYYKWSTNYEEPFDSETWILYPDTNIVSIEDYDGNGQDGRLYLHAMTNADGQDCFIKDTFLFDNTNPELEIKPITSMNNGEAQIAAVEVNYDDLSNITLYSKWNDETEWTEEECNIITRNSGEGYYTLQVKAVDEAGNEIIENKIAIENEEMIDIGYSIDSIGPEGSILNAESTTPGVISVSQSAIDVTSNKEDLQYAYSIDDGLTWNAWIDYSDTFDITVPAGGNIDLSIKYRDKLGNISDVYKTQVEVEVPTGKESIYITYSPSQDIITNNIVSATVNIPQELEEEGYRVINNLGRKNYKFSDNGTFTFELENNSGEKHYITASVNNIDLNAPTVVDVFYSITEVTNKEVTMTIVTDEPVEFDSEFVVMSDLNGYQHQYTFTKNKSITLSFKDKAGNENTVNGEVNWIDLEPPTLNYSLDIEEVTESNVTVTINADEKIRILNNKGLNKYVFTENGEFIFKIQDMAGNEVEYITEITNIDRNLPELWIEYSTTEVTKDPVIATVYADREIEILNNDANISYTFNKNGVFTFLVLDVAEDILYDIDAVVTNIDLEAPEMTFEHYGNGIFAVNGSYVLDDYIIKDNYDTSFENQVEIDESELNINKPGTYTIKYTVWDDVGNTAEFTRDVLVISNDSFSIYINNNKVNNFDQIIIEDNKAVIQVFTQGNFNIKTKKGDYKPNQLKEGATKLKDNVITTYQECWYSIYIQDQERNTKFIKIYFIPEI